MFFIEQSGTKALRFATFSAVKHPGDESPAKKASSAHGPNTQASNATVAKMHSRSGSKGAK